MGELNSGKSDVFSQGEIKTGGKVQFIGVIQTSKLARIKQARKSLFRATVVRESDLTTTKGEGVYY